jgi:hypothetical protein
MPFSTNGKNTMLNAWGAAAAYCSLHSGLPDDNGSLEISGGSPAYARKAIAWAAASGGSLDKNATDPVFDVPAGASVFFVGLWSALTGGNFLGYAPINGGTTEGFAIATASGDSIASYAHGLANADRVLLRAPVNEALPTGLSASTLYYVINATTNNFQVSLTAGGAAVDITADGELYFQKVVPETYGSQGTLAVDTGTFAIN